jgi:hypothetical protein
MCHKEGKAADTTRTAGIRRCNVDQIVACTYRVRTGGTSQPAVAGGSNGTRIGSAVFVLSKIAKVILLFFHFVSSSSLPRPTGPRLGQRERSFAKDQKIVFGQTRHVHFLDLDESRPFNLASKGSLIGPQMLYYPSGVV